MKYLNLSRLNVYRTGKNLSMSPQHMKKEEDQSISSRSNNEVSPTKFRPNGFKDNEKYTGRFSSVFNSKSI